MEVATRFTARLRDDKRFIDTNDPAGKNVNR